MGSDFERCSPSRARNFPLLCAPRWQDASFLHRYRDRAGDAHRHDSRHNQHASNDNPQRHAYLFAYGLDTHYRAYPGVYGLQRYEHAAHLGDVLRKKTKEVLKAQAAAVAIVAWAMRQGFYCLVMEGEVEPHEGCKGPECDCWKEPK